MGIKYTKSLITIRKIMLLKKPGVSLGLWNWDILILNIILPID
jgi:hypothetical protein